MSLDNLQFPCSACGATLTFDPSAANLSCSHCGYSEEIPGSDAEVVERDFQSFVADSEDWNDGIRHWKCQACSATTTTERTVTAHRCSFCGSNLVSSADDETHTRRPESLLPFRVSEKEALHCFRKWIRSLWFRPNALKSQARAGAIDGTYVPYWTFDALTRSFWTAESGTYYYVEDSKGNRKRRVRWRRVNGTHTAFYDDELVPGTTVVNSALLNQVEPYPTEDLIGYRTEYLAGHTAVAYEHDMLACWPTAKSRIDSDIRSACRRSIPGDTHRGLSVNTSYHNQTYKLCLLPIWIASYRYRNETYSYIVNGVTGTIAGKAPWSLSKLLGAATAIAGLGYGLYLYLY